MSAAWVRLSPATLAALGPVKWRRKSGTMLMATASKKHLTVFVRRREARGAGKPIVKKIFAEGAAKTRGEPFREERNIMVREYMLKELPKYAAELGVYRKKSRSKVAGEPGVKCPLYYEYKYEWKPGASKKPPTNLAHIVLKK